MANLIDVTVLKINGLPQNSALTLSFPTQEIMIQAITDTNENVNSKLTYYSNEYFLSETVSECETLAGANMVAATVYLINQMPFNAAKDFLFPSVNISIAEFDDTPVQSAITYNNNKYYAEETQSALVTSANAGSGGDGSSLFPTNGIGTATGGVIADMNGNHILVEQGGNSFLAINPTANNEMVELRAFNTTGDDNAAGVNGAVTDISASAEFYAAFNDGAKMALIVLNADDTESSLTYTADTHTFEGDVIGASLFQKSGTGTAAGNVIGDLGGFGDAFYLSILGSVGIGVAPTSDQLLIVSDGTTELIVDRTTETITLTAANGVNGIFIPPTSDPLVAGAIWNNAGTLAISAG